MQNAIRRSAVVTALAVVLGGCASYAWTKPDITADVAARDERSCRTEARDLSMQYAVGGFGVPWGYPPWQRPWGGPYGDPSWQAAAEQRVFESCMRGRGYDLVRVDTPR